jgi:KDO2-lipid IV(A) lauroyltransferase
MAASYLKCIVLSRETLPVKKIKQPKLTLALLKPKYWPTWLVLAVMFIINTLPFRAQLFIGTMIGKLLYGVFKSRRKIALRNLELCFPDMAGDEREKIVKRNIENTAIALFESGIAWWWPNWRFARMTRMKGYEHIQKARAQGKGVLLLMAHSLHLEIDGRVFGLKHEGIGFYRPHNNPVMEYFQYNGRCKSNKYMIGKRNVRGLIDALKQGEVCYYLPDQDYGAKRCEFVPFFAVNDTATTTGPLLFAEQSNCAIIPMLSARLPGAQGYEIELLPAFDNMPSGDDAGDVTRINQWVEQTVAANIDQYMWVHRRFKTQPDPDAPPRYK